MQPSNEFWHEQALSLWDAVDELALASLMAGAASGELLLPKALKPLINEEFFNAAAMRYLRLYQLRNVAQISETTRRHAVSMIEDWLRSGEALPTLENRLATILNSRRAAQIAVTEVTRLFAQGNIMLWQSVGVVTSKVWRTARDEKVCPLCGPLDGVTVSMEAQFSQPPEVLANSPQMKALLGGRWSQEAGLRKANNFIKWNGAGVEAPPRHVNCRCYLQPVVEIPTLEESINMWGI